MMIVMLLLKKGAVKTYTSMSINGVIHPLSAKGEKDDFLSRFFLSSLIACRRKERNFLCLVELFKNKAVDEVE